MQESTRQPLKNWEIIFGMATPTSENAKERQFQVHFSQREALPASLFPKRASPVPLWTHTGDILLSGQSSSPGTMQYFISDG